ncbi:acyl-CoA N-acyltransferase [Lophiotrema nucula]|uniref:Acyl-CoA N-acyltransferase n=1 Tax=Lophiotrema nucula TaxID=690887 RepID=A0A6A5YQH1_9PLEO|nr:acyl-CoA N-acyltransferase [Lophiotrema nucula]
MPDPNLKVSLLEPDEAHLYQAVRHETFRPTINKILYTNQPEISDTTMANVIDGIKKGITNDGILYLKCVDQGTGEVIAGARWRYLGPSASDWASGVRERTEEEVEKDLVVPSPYPESDPRVWNQLFAGFAEHKRRDMATRPYYILETLITHPLHQRRGAGALLVNWGCEKADEKGVECFVEASPMGRPLYERYGFEECGRMSVDVGGEEFDFIMMRRPAKVRS